VPGLDAVWSFTYLRIEIGVKPRRNFTLPATWCSNRLSSFQWRQLIWAHQHAKRSGLAGRAFKMTRGLECKHHLVDRWR